jgi:hypothetical protein
MASVTPCAPAATVDVEAFLTELKQEFPGFRIVPKRGNRFSLSIDSALRVVTLGKMRTFMTEYHTVIGETLYVPDSWQRMSDVAKVILLRHERVHLRQKRRLTFVGLAFVYLVPWFPLGLAYGRARLEWEAYVETLRATHELLGPEAARDAGLRRHIVRRFCGADYGWMWPFPGRVERWYDAALAALESDPPHTPGPGGVLPRAPRSPHRW